MKKILSMLTLLCVSVGTLAARGFNGGGWGGHGFGAPAGGAPFALFMILRMVVPALIIVGLIILFVVLFKRLYKDRLKQGDEALRILRERYARGEIDEEELRRKSQTLNSLE